MKQVHWQLPFASLNGTQYRIDIYAEGAPVGGIRQLTGGATPFTTDEDNSDDFFANVRGWTGCMNIVDSDGSLLEQITPENNVSNHVRLIRVNSDQTEDIVLQGFLSTEVYSQEYTDRPREITINVNSILEAMKSTDYIEDEPQLRYIKEILSYVFDSCEVNGVSFRNVYIPFSSNRIIMKCIDTTMFFDLREESNEYHTSYIVTPKDCNYILDQLCSYMDWTVMERGEDIYFIDKYDNHYCVIPRNEITRFDLFTPPYSTKVDLNMDNLGWRGIDHQINISQGARFVEVKAAMEDYHVKSNIPSYCPAYPETREDIGTCVTYYSPDIEFDNRCTFINRLLLVDLSDPSNPYVRDVRETSVETTHNYSVLKYDRQEEEDTPYYKSFHIGAFMAMLQDNDKPTDESEDSTYMERESGVYLATLGYMQAVGYGYMPTPTNYIMRINSMTRLAASIGHIKLSLKGYKIERSYYDHTDKLVHTDDPTVTIAIKCGEWYLDANNGWNKSFSYFTFSKNSDEFDHNPPPGFDIGTVEVFIYPVGDIGGGGMSKDEYLITDLYVEYEPQEGLNENEENTYSRRTNSAFSEEVNKESKLVTSMSNRNAPNIVYEAKVLGRMKMLDYLTTELTPHDGYVKWREKPEIVLVERLKDYYSKPRRKIEVVVGDNMPMLTRIIGYDERVYAPLSESRDWKADTSTITCFEAPE